MKKWEEKEGPDGTVVHTACVRTHGNEPKVIVAAVRDQKEVG